MSKYTITESVGRRVEQVNSFEDLEKHHPSSGREAGRQYATINGKLEEVRNRDGHTYIKKDFILSQDTPGPVEIPAPVAGYIHYLKDSTNAVRIYDKPFGTPGATMLAQSLHMRRNSSPPEGSFIQYGQAMGRMGDTGSPGSVHAHVEVELKQFQRYIGDIANGIIQPGKIPPQQEPVSQQTTKPPQPETPKPQATTSTPDAQTSADSPLSRLIARGEGNYGSYNRGRAGDARGATIDFSQMTVGEIMQQQALPQKDPNRLFAVGKYQMVPVTMKETVERMKIDPNERFTPELQERMFSEYLIGNKRPAIRAYISGKSGDSGLQNAQLALAQEFASVANPKTGLSYYAGKGGNGASISANEVKTALNAMRTSYRECVNKGMSADEAWKAVTAVHGSQQNKDQPSAQKQETKLESNIYRLGSSGTEVELLQGQLKQLGIRDAQGRELVPDGKFGPNTKAAVEALQRQQGITADGIVGAETKRALQEALKQQQEKTGVPLSPAVKAIDDKIRTGFSEPFAQHNVPPKPAEAMTATTTCRCVESGMNAANITRVHIDTNQNKLVVIGDNNKFVSVDAEQASRQNPAEQYAQANQHVQDQTKQAQETEQLQRQTQQHAAPVLGR